MKKHVCGLIGLCFVLLMASFSVQAAYIEESFDTTPAGSPMPAGWAEFSQIPDAQWTIVETEGNRILQGIAPFQGLGIAGPDSATGYYFEHLDAQVSVNILSGNGGGLGIGQVDRDNVAYNGNAYSIEISANAGKIRFWEVGLSAGMRIVAEVAVPIVRGTWYDVRFLSTGTYFEVYFREKSDADWTDSERVIQIPHDIAHPGKKSYVDGLVGLWSDYEGSASTIQFDDFKLDAKPFPAAIVFEDDFNDAATSLSQWLPLWVDLDLSAQTAEITGNYGRNGGISIHSGAQYYTYMFQMKTDVLVNQYSMQGLFWGWEKGVQELPDGSLLDTDTDYHIEINGQYDRVVLTLCEEENSSNGSTEDRLITVYDYDVQFGQWYTIELIANYTNYDVYWYKAGDPRPATPTYSVAQAQLHPGYRFTNAGAAGLFTDLNKQSVFDNFSFTAIPKPVTNTEPGTDVTVDVEVDPESPVSTEDLSLTFETVTDSGSTSVEVSTAGPDEGPGSFQLLGSASDPAPLYYDITTTCVFEGLVTVALPYEEGLVPANEEADLKMFHYNTAAEAWEDITTSVDTVNNIIYGETTSFSPFAIAKAPSFVGFFSPINMPPMEMSIFKLKRTIPVKFRLVQNGQPVPDMTALIGVYKVSDGVPGEVNELGEESEGDSGILFRYDAEEQQYIYNLRTKSLTRGVYRIKATIVETEEEYCVDIALK